MPLPFPVLSIAGSCTGDCFDEEPELPVLEPRELLDAPPRDEDDEDLFDDEDLLDDEADEDRFEDPDFLLDLRAAFFEADFLLGAAFFFEADFFLEELLREDFLAAFFLEAPLLKPFLAAFFLEAAFLRGAAFFLDFFFAAIH